MSRFACTFIVVLSLSQVAPDRARDRAASHARERVDPAFIPRVGDKVFLGVTDPNEAAAGKLGRINSCEAFGSLEAAAEFLRIDPDEDGRIDPRPDGYMVRATTTAEVRERKVVEVVRDGNPAKMVACKVEVREGEFKDRLLWVASYQVFRFKVPFKKGED
jgi:hypothetical protein